jgi:hypothetical protein
MTNNPSSLTALIVVDVQRALREANDQKRIILR